MSQVYWVTVCIHFGVFRDLVEGRVRKDLEKDILTFVVVDDSSRPQSKRGVLQGSEGRICIELVGVDEELIAAAGGRDVDGIAVVSLINLGAQLVEEPGLTLDSEP